MRRPRRSLLDTLVATVIKTLPTIKIEEPWPLGGPPPRRFRRRKRS